MASDTPWSGGAPTIRVRYSESTYAAQQRLRGSTTMLMTHKYCFAIALAGAIWICAANRAGLRRLGSSARRQRQHRLHQAGYRPGRAADAVNSSGRNLFRRGTRGRSRWHCLHRQSLRPGFGLPPERRALLGPAVARWAVGDGLAGRGRGRFGICGSGDPIPHSRHNQRIPLRIHLA